MFKTVELKLGNMRKSAEFVVYPTRSDGGVQSNFIVQSDKRIARINKTTGAGVLSNGKGHPGFHALLFNTIPITVSAEILKQLSENQPKSGDEVGPGVTIA